MSKTGVSDEFSTENYGVFNPPLSNGLAHTWHLKLLFNKTRTSHRSCSHLAPSVAVKSVNAEMSVFCCSSDVIHYVSMSSLKSVSSTIFKVGTGLAPAGFCLFGKL